MNHPRWNKLRNGLAVAFTAAVVIGNISFPVAVLAGWVKTRPATANSQAQR